MIEKKVHRIDLKYIFLIFIAVFASTIFHELSHWSIGEILGNQMVATLNGTNPISGEYLHEWNKNYITLAGPLFTVLQAILFYFLLAKYKKIELYPFLFFPLVMRFAAGLANFMGANDEGRLGLSFGIGLFTISIIVCSFLFILVYRITKELKISMKFNIISFILCCLFLLLLTFVDAKFKVKLI
jgi:hypothetical protein